MVEADSHLQLFPASILDIYKVYEHIDMLLIAIISSILNSLTAKYVLAGETLVATNSIST